MRDYFKLFPQKARLNEIATLLAEKDHWLTLDKKGLRRFRTIMEPIAHLRAKTVDVTGNAVRIGTATEIDETEREKVLAALRGFMPWRKGPFEVFGIPIDAEWQSDRKWNRVLPALPPLEGKVIADIGSNNGYYMFRMAQHNPRLVLGFEPYLHHYNAFQTLNRMAGFDNLHTELLGVEHLGLLENSFDLILLMGILYHHASPIAILRDVKQALKPGGALIVESQIIPGQDPVALFPEGRYAKAPGTYFVPTAPCLANWLKRAGFNKVECFFTHPMNNEEQRCTEWMEFESYSDFIDPADPEKTVEGYPAPHRAYLRGIAP